MKILVTGAHGFVGKHLQAHLKRESLGEFVFYDVDSQETELQAALATSDLVIHLAGANRPADPADFERINVGFTRRICEGLEKAGRRAPIVFSSSTQAELDNPYGKSKLQAESVVRDYAARVGTQAYVLRITNVFGPWCRPGYNSVVATFCHNLTHGKPIEIRDPAAPVRLVFVEDVVAMLIGILKGEFRERAKEDLSPGPVREIPLGELADKLRVFSEMRATRQVPSMKERFDRALYATYLSYYERPELAYAPDLKSDQRGSLFELIRSEAAGQIFVSTTKPGQKRGGHYHFTKTEKFVVIHGEGVIRMTHILSGEEFEFRVSGSDVRIVDIAPGYSHVLENVGSGEMITLFWACEPFDPERPDTYALK